MKKYFKYLFYVVFLFICFAFEVNAETTTAEDKTCNYASKAYLNKIAGSVTASYDFKYENDGSVSFDITVYNITEDLYINVKSSGNNLKVKEENFTISSYMVKDNKYTFNVKDTENIIEYKFTVRTLKYGCTHDIRNFTLVKPMKNELHDLDICKYEEVLDYYYCQEWLTSKFNGTEEDIKEKIIREKENKKKKTTTKCVDCEKTDKNTLREENLKRIKMYIIIGLVIGIITDLIVIIVLINNIRRSTL